jgi:pimeloyl-ACP methyl ester carboxylesterase
MTEPILETLQLDDIRMRVASQGSGPMVLFCHGWPESWYSWRHQMAAVAAAGYRAVAPDMRGYGGTDAPDNPARYTLLHLVGDLVGLLKTLGEGQAVLVGHDWGAPVAWHAALLRPDLFRAVVGMSVPYAPPWRTDLLSALEKQGVHDFYIQYFQTPGVAEAEFERDVDASMRRIYYSGSGDAPAQVSFGMLAAGAGYLGNTIDPEVLPDWMGADDIAYYASEFRRTGFRGGLNWYRCLRLNAELLAPWRGAPIQQPSMFIAGARDAVLRFPASQSQIDRFPSTLPGLRGCHVLEGAGHWIQRERAAQVNTLLLEFLEGL